MPDQLLFYDKETDSVITVWISKSGNLRPDEGYVLFAENKVLLGSDLYDRYHDIKNNSEKIKKLFEQLTVIRRKELE